jgi:hypothetical protein
MACYLTYQVYLWFLGPSIQTKGGKMVLNLQNALLFTCLLVPVQFAQASSDLDYMKVARIEMREISRDVLNQEVLETVYSKNLPVQDGRKEAPKTDKSDPLERAGKVISMAKDLVALGEDVYKLVIKGKPSNTTNYAPISVIPKENGQPVDIMSTEFWNLPETRTFEVVYENLYGIDVVTFRYSVIFAYGGSYEGKGAYLTAVQIVPEYVRTLFGFDFTATMKLGGIQNNGSRQDPVAGATLLLESTVSSVMTANTSVHAFFVTGKGKFTSYQK